MTQKFIVTHIGDEGETILAHAAEPGEVIDVVVDDLMSSDAWKELPADDREAVFRAEASLNDLTGPHGPECATVSTRTYRVERLPDDPAAHDEFYRFRFGHPNLIKLLCRLPGKLRYEIWPNESQHRGRPHCKASNREKAANFSIPDGERIVGDLRPDEREASETIQKHGEELLTLWHRTRPDDQKL